MKTKFYNGQMYQIQLVYSNCFYGNKKIYHIHTDVENYCEAYKAIESIMDDGSWNVGLRQIRIKKEGMVAALHSYHTFSFDEDLNVFVYTFIRPYDD